MVTNDSSPMMNINEKDVDLSLSLGSPSYRADISGAGVNASSIFDMAFASSDPIAELVWSPHKGLTLKCAGSSSADKPFLMWNVGPSSTALITPSQCIIDHGKLTDSQIPDDGDSKGGDRDYHTAGGGEVKKGPNVPEKDICDSKNVRIDDVMESRVKKSDLRSTSVDHQAMIPSSIPAPSPVNIEASAENDLCENSLNVEKTPMICLYQEKGKQKALSDGRSSNDDDSNDSLESCNSIGVSSRGVKRRNFGRELTIFESKKMKKQIQEKTSFKPDSSFMYWISNMVKGLADSKKRESPSLDLTLDVHGKNHRENFKLNESKDIPRLNTGFQNIFQSMYRRDTYIPKSYSARESRELVVADKTSIKLSNSNSCEKIGISNEVENPSISRNIVPCETILAENKIEGKSVAENSSPDFPLSIRNTPEKTNYMASLWITRLSSKTPLVQKCNPISQRIPDCSVECEKVNLETRVKNNTSVEEEEDVHASAKKMLTFSSNPETSVDFNSAKKLNPILPSPDLISSEPMASTFARRVDALKHNIPSKRKKTLTCFYCGGIGHDLHVCPEVTKNELGDLIVKISSFDGLEESRFCIRCYKLDHWASSCSLSRHLPSLSREIISTSDEIQKSIAYNMENDIKENIDDVPLFDAIRKLRLSRVDILRWMSSHLSLTNLNGFFVRLRIGNSEAAVGGTGYYVACITGDTRENIGCISKKSLLVDVGGMKSRVESQYVSNHDFSEDDIKAWCCRMLKAGCKLPCIDELNSKFEERKTLGL